MKSLRELILEELGNTNAIQIEAEEYIDDNYDIRGKLTFEIVNGLCVVNCGGDVEVKNKEIAKLTDGFVWGEVMGSFDCFGCHKLESLEGAPKYVGEDFDCSQCENLKSLEGASKEVGESFNCSECAKLESLEGAPEELNGGFYCHVCPNIISLEGAPKKVGGTFGCRNCSITSLKGSPKKVGDDFICRNCPDLHSLEGIGKVMGKIFSDIN